MAEVSSVAFLKNAKKIIKDLSVRELIEEAVCNGEGTFAQNGALRVVTGKHTGRSPNDKFIVDTPLTHGTVCWSNNKPCSPETFTKLYAKMCDFVKKHKVYVSDLNAGADDKYSLRVKFINELAWQQLFVKQLFIYKTLVCFARKACETKNHLLCGWAINVIQKPHLSI